MLMREGGGRHQQTPGCQPQTLRGRPQTPGPPAQTLVRPLFRILGRPRLKLRAAPAAGPPAPAAGAGVGVGSRLPTPCSAPVGAAPPILGGVAGVRSSTRNPPGSGLASGIPYSTPRLPERCATVLSTQTLSYLTPSAVSCSLEMLHRSTCCVRHESTLIFPIAAQAHEAHLHLALIDIASQSAVP